MTTAVLGIRILLAAVFAVAGIAKLRDLEGSRAAMRDFGVPRRLAPIAGVALPLLELAVAVALVPTTTARWAALVALLLLLAFIAGIARALRRGESPDCHCFGQLHSEPVGPATLVRNAVLAALALFVVVEAPGTALDDWVAARSAAELVAVGASIAAVFFGVGWAYMWHQRRGLVRPTRACTAACNICCARRSDRFQGSRLQPPGSLGQHHRLARVAAPARASAAPDLREPGMRVMRRAAAKDRALATLAGRPADNRSHEHWASQDQPADLRGARHYG